LRFGTQNPKSAILIISMNTCIKETMILSHIAISSVLAVHLKGDTVSPEVNTSEPKTAAEEGEAQFC
jgi:hypothetical protein